ncbi:MAG TPA: hypothetical protein VFZ15_04745 [Acidimicrobiia bacterium]|nr:hypothetical protein [Acidimicrobiia bacterium]
MIRLAASVILAVELGGGFGSATAAVVSSNADSAIVEIEVEVEGGPDTVVAHLSLPGEETIVLPLLSRDDGVYGVTTELKLADYSVVFEVVGSSGTQSEPVTLSDLGADLASGDGVTDTTAPEDGQDPETRRWLWLGVALGAASLSVLAFWVLGGREEPEADEPGAQPPPDEPSSGS